MSFFATFGNILMYIQSLYNDFSVENPVEKVDNLDFISFSKIQFMNKKIFCF